MTWYPKYRAEWADYLNYQHKVDIEDTVDPGTIINLTADGDPFEIEHLTTEDDIHNNPIKGSKANLKVKALSNFQLDGLYTTQEQQYRMSKYDNGVLAWQGYLFPDVHNEPYDAVPYTMVISANDQLGILKNITYDDSGTLYNGRIRESKIILDILAKIGLTQFTEYINIYESGMASGTTDSPMDQLSIDVDIFAGLSCYDVLNEILRKYNAIIRNVKGQMTIYRPVELSGTDVYGRIFTGETTKSGTHIHPLQLINRSGSASELRDVNSGTKLYKAPAKKITIKLDCGNKLSWLENWQMLNETITGSLISGYVVEDWIDQSGDPYPVVLHMPGENAGALLNAHNSYPVVFATSKCIYQSFGTNAVITSDIFTLEFDYLIYNDSGTGHTGHQYYIGLKSDSTNNWLVVDYAGTDFLVAKWQATTGAVTYNGDCPIGTTGWNHQVIKWPGLPANGSYTIKLFAADSAESLIYVAYKNVQIYSVSTQSQLIKKFHTQYGSLIDHRAKPLFPNSQVRFTQYYPDQKYSIFSAETGKVVSELTYSKSNAINGREDGITFICGDVLTSAVALANILNQYAGSLARISANESLTQAALRFVTLHASGYPDVTLSVSGTYIYITANTPGTDFAYTVVFTNVSGNIAGTVSTTQANSAGTAQKDQITLSGASGSCDIIVDAGNIISESMAYYGSSIADTIDNFIATKAGYYNDYILTRVSTDILQIEETGSQVGIGFTSSVTNNGISGSVVTTQTAVGAIVRIDRIALTGTTGSATVAYSSSYTLDIAVGTTLTPTTVWNTRGGSENKPLLHIICDEIANQMKRPRQMIAGWPIREGSRVDNTVHLDVLGRLEDSLNEDPDTSDSRMFVFNRGSFDAKGRKWEADYIEII